MYSFSPSGRQALGQRLVEVDGAPAVLGQPQGQQEILGDAFGGKPADGLERLDAHHRRGAGAHGDAPGVAGRLDMVEEEALLVRIGAGDAEIVLDRIRVEEMLRRLHQAGLAVVEQGQAAADEVLVRHEIGVEHGDEVRRVAVGRAQFQRMVEVAGLGMGIVGPGDVVDAVVEAGFRQPGAAAVVEHEDAGRAEQQRFRPDDGALEDGAVLVIGGDIDIHRRRRPRPPPLRIVVGLLAPVLGARQDQEGAAGGYDGHGFQDGEAIGDDDADAAVEGRQGGGEAPPHVAGRQHHRQQHERRAHARVVAVEERQEQQRQADDHHRRRQARHIGAERDHRYRPIWLASRCTVEIGPVVKMALPVRPTAQLSSGSAAKLGHAQRDVVMLEMIGAGADREIVVERAGARSGQADHRGVEHAAVVEQAEARRRADLQAVVQPLGDAGGDDDGRAIDQPHQILAAANEIAAIDQEIPHGAGRRWRSASPRSAC